MRKDKVQILFLLDSSTSMSGMADEVRDRTAQFLHDKQQLSAQDQIEISFSLITFDSLPKQIYWRQNVNHIMFNKDKYNPSGMTVLYDAIGIYVNKLGKQLAEQNEQQRPGKVIVVILTDGQENASQKYRDRNIIKQIIDTQQNKYSWQFIFLSTDINSFDDAKNYFNINNTVMFDQNKQSYNTTYVNLNKNIRSSVRRGKQDNE